MGVYKINFSIIISDKDGKELIREKIITEIPNEWNYTTTRRYNFNTWSLLVVRG